MREPIVFLILTVCLIGAPALPLWAELRDPGCVEAAESNAEADHPLRARAVEGHPIERCLPSSAPPAGPVVAMGTPKGEPAGGRSW